MGQRKENQNNRGNMGSMAPQRTGIRIGSTTADSRHPEFRVRVVFSVVATTAWIHC